jgi:hypothetical protein
MSMDRETFDSDEGAVVPIPKIDGNPLDIVDDSALVRRGGNSSDIESGQIHLTGLAINDVDVANIHILAAREQHRIERGDNTDDDDDYDGTDDDDDAGNAGEETVKVGEDGDLEFAGGATSPSGKKRGSHSQRGVLMYLGENNNDDDDGDGVREDGSDVDGDNDDEDAEIAAANALFLSEEGGDDEERNGDSNTVQVEDDSDDDAARFAAWKPALPMSVIKKLVDLVAPAPISFSKEARLAVNCAVELIVQDLAGEVLRTARRRKAKQISYDLIAEVVSHEDRFNFLADVIPLPSVGTLVQLGGSGAGKRKAAAASAAMVVDSSSSAASSAAGSDDDGGELGSDDEAAPAAASRKANPKAGGKASAKSAPGKKAAATAKHPAPKAKGGARAGGKKAAAAAALANQPKLDFFAAKK